MEKKKGFFKEFKEFITRGNIVDMAVGVIIGGAFSAIVTAFTNKVIKPFIDWIVMMATGGKSLGLYTFMKKVMMNTVDEAGNVVKEIDFTNSIYIDWGAFIMAIIDFLLIALVLFIIVKVMMSVKAASADFHDADKRELRELARQRAAEQGISRETAMADILAERKAAEEAEAAAKEAEEAAKPTPEKLLAEIRDLLAAQYAVKEEVAAEEVEAEEEVKAEAEAEVEAETEEASAEQTEE